MATTEYLVLRKVGIDDVWEEVGFQPATGASKAARDAAEREDIPGDYVAVPTRSFQPVTFEFKSVRRAVVSSGVKTDKGNAVTGVATGGLVGSSAGSAA